MEPFASAKLLVERAGEHVDDFKRKCDAFFKRKPYAQFVDTKSKPGKELYKLRLVEEIPIGWSTLVADAINNLRHALDHATVASARAAGVADVTKIYFPFCRDVGELDSTIRRKCKGVPAEVTALMPGFKPYKGGDDTLWALTRLAATNKHQMLTGILTAADSINVHAMTLFGSKDGLFVPGWDSSKNELTFAEIPAGTELQYDLGVTFSIAFGDVEIVGGERVLPILHELGSKIWHILSRIEAACRDGGYIT